MDLNVKQWANEILSTMEDACNFEINPTDKDFVFRATNRKDGANVDISLNDSGLVFLFRGEIDNFNWSDTGLFNSINSSCGILKCWYEIQNDICVTCFSFCYPTYATANNVFVNTFDSFTDEIGFATKMFKNSGYQVFAP